MSDVATVYRAMQLLTEAIELTQPFSLASIQAELLELNSYMARIATAVEAIESTLAP